jgi:hypothetical protein
MQPRQLQRRRTLEALAVTFEIARAREESMVQNVSCGGGKIAQLR